jgi:hypothetical protein
MFQHGVDAAHTHIFGAILHETLIQSTQAMHALQATRHRLVLQRALPVLLALLAQAHAYSALLAPTQ